MMDWLEYLQLAVSLLAGLGVLSWLREWLKRKTRAGRLAELLERFHLDRLIDAVFDRLVRWGQALEALGEPAGKARAEMVQNRAASELSRLGVTLVESEAEVRTEAAYLRMLHAEGLAAKNGHGPATETPTRGAPLT